jgi:hypothetical protein
MIASAENRYSLECSVAKKAQYNKYIFVLVWTRLSVMFGYQRNYKLDEVLRNLK